MFNSAKQEVIVVAYRLTAGHGQLREALESSLARGMIVKIVINKEKDQHPVEKAFIDELLKRYSNLSVWDFDDDKNDMNVALHAKLVVADRSRAVIGSANFSKNGLLENHEIAVCVSGSQARSTCVLVETLIDQGLKTGVLKKRSVL